MNRKVVWLFANIEWNVLEKWLKITIGDRERVQIILSFDVDCRQNTHIHRATDTMALQVKREKIQVYLCVNQESNEWNIEITIIFELFNYWFPSFIFCKTTTATSARKCILPMEDRMEFSFSFYSRKSLCFPIFVLNRCCSAHFLVWFNFSVCRFWLLIQNHLSNI